VGRSCRRLTVEERILIERLHKRGLPLHQIARPWIQAVQSLPESKDHGIHPARSPEATKLCTPV